MKPLNPVNMQRLFLLLTAALLTASLNAQLPYNPDSDADGLITVSDLGEFLTVFGQPFDTEGIVPIENGGTGAATAAAARDSLGLSMFLDSTMMINGDDLPVGWVTGRLRVENSIIEGFGTEASGDFAHAEGYETTASGSFAHSQNRFTNASGTCAHAEGEGSSATGTAAHAEGFQSSATQTAAHAEGFQTQAIGLYSHAANRWTIADGICAHAEGEGTQALADAAHSEGYQTEALAFAAHAEGYQSIASGAFSHAENRGNVASGQNSHAQGFNTLASGTRSHAGGNATIADQNDQTAIGRFNQPGQMGTLFVVGNGTSDNLRNDAFKVEVDGRVSVAADLEVGGQVLVDGENLMQVIALLQQSNDLLQQQIDALQQQINDLTSGE